jgi:hypothetical protein
MTGKPINEHGSKPRVTSLTSEEPTQPDDGATDRGLAGPLLALVAVGLAAWYALGQLTRGPDINFDDAYMFIRYARHMLDGYGFAWNPDGVQTYGCTSVLFTLLVTVLRGASEASDAALLRGASVGLGLGAVLVMVLTARRFCRAPALRGRLWLWAGTLVPVLVCSPVFIYHARTGMDTTLSLLLNSCLIYATLALLERPDGRRLAATIVVGYLGYLSRPDNGLYAALVPGLAIFLGLPADTRWSVLKRFGLGLGALLAVDAALKLAIFGVALPLPVFAKLSGHYADYAGGAMWNPMAYLLTFLGTVAPFVVILLLFAERRAAALLLPLLLPVGMTLAVYFRTTQIMGYQARFSYPSLPFVVLAAVLCLDRSLVAHGGLSIRSRRLGTRLLIVLALAGLFPVAEREAPAAYKRQFMHGPPADKVDNPGRLPLLRYWDSMQAVTRIARRAPEGTVLCMSEYGYLGAAVPELSILDPLGLHDREAALVGFSAETLLAKLPDVIWFPHTDYVGIRRELLAHEALWRDYAVYPAAFSYGFALRLEGPRAAALQAIVQDVWRAVYPGQPMPRHRASGPG